MKLAFLITASLTMTTVQFCNKKTEVNPIVNSEAGAQSDNVQTTKFAQKSDKKAKVIKASFKGKKLHPQKQYCVWYEHTGQMMSGNSQMCSRKYGQETFTISNTSVGMLGITQSQNTHTVVKGETIYNINLDTMTATKAKNPMYEGLSKADPKDLNRQMLNAMGLSDSGEDKIIAGVKCSIFNSAQFGTACFTDNMILLEQSVMGNTQTATKVDLQSGGANKDYNLYKTVPLSDAPDVGKILEQLGRR